ncbi:FAD-dependent oxidoreductase [Thermophagus sp. OGC60D27]|uniref:FAD-dependent oxidoreductase n=1 Tax=Thermophagus sp. OGC60D27 TaxID=3458415 RepID=UPI004037D9AB
MQNISRRQFIERTAATAGFAALASMGLGWGQNKPTLQSKDMLQKQLQTDVLVIGGGMAGLFAAVKARDAGAKVMLVSKGRLGSSGSTPFAKGMFEFDPATSKYSLDEFVDAVGRSSLGTNNPVYTRQMAEHSKARIEELRQWGFFDSAIYHKSFSQPVTERNIPVIERVMVTHLIKENGSVAGAAGFSIDERKTYIFRAKSVILCTGAGGFKPNGFPINDLTHDGTIMAYNIGAKVTGKEWNDGHPGKSENPAACYDGWGDMFEQKPGTTSVDIHHDLGMELNYLAYINGNPVSGGPGAPMTNLPEGQGPYVPEEFRHNDRKAPQEGRGEQKGQKPPRGQRPQDDGKPPKEGGAPPGMGGIPVGGSSAGMAIHKSEGLVPVNDKCQSNIPGLYAAGDALGSYMSGAIYTQVGSSLTGSAVQGAVAGQAAAQYAQSIRKVEISQSKIKQIEEEIYAPLNREAGYSPAYVTHTLQSIIIPNFILYIKKEKLMKAALAYVEELRDHHMPMLRASDLHELRLAHETANMIISAEMKLKASIMRTESRCSHYRLDYPNPDNENWQAWINIYKAEDGSMKLEKQPFSHWR